MINGLCVGLVGGIEAEAGMLGQPVYFSSSPVVGVHKGQLQGVTATDLSPYYRTASKDKGSREICGVSW